MIRPFQVPYFLDGKVMTPSMLSLLLIQADNRHTLLLYIVQILNISILTSEHGGNFDT